MLPATLAHLGSISSLGWGITFLVVVGMALIFNKINSITSQQGGVIASIQTCFGSYVGVQMTLFYWVSAWAGNCALLLAVVGYLSFFFPVLHQSLYGALACVIILWSAVGLGLFGARKIGAIQLLTGGCMVGAILIISAGGWQKFDSNMYWASWNVSGQTDIQVTINAAAISLWGFLGIESASVASGQVNDPQRIVPLATILGLAITGLCYAGSCNIIMGVLPHQILLNSASPFSETASQLWGGNAGKLISIVVIIACLGAIPGWQILQTEVPAAAADKKLLPSILGVRNRYNVPWVSLVLTASLMTFVLLCTQCGSLQQQFTLIIQFAVVASLFPYLFAVLSLPLMLLKKQPVRPVVRITYSSLSIIVFSALATAVYFQPRQVLYGVILLQLLSMMLFVFKPASARRQVQQ